MRALDTMNDLTMKKKGVGVDRFLVAGASKVRIVLYLCDIHVFKSDLNFVYNNL